MPDEQQAGRVGGLVKIVQGLTLTNVLVIALLVVIAIPAYTLWKALNDERIMDRFLSVYQERPDHRSGCLIRHVKERGGPDLWSISSGFALQGVDRWFVSVVLSHEPDESEVASYCETAKLIADTMVSRGSDVTVPPDTE